MNETNRLRSSRASALGFLVLPVLFSVIATPGLSAAVYYVAKTGSDSGSGSLTSPFLTINRGIRALTPGGTLSIRGGTYAESLGDEIPSGTSWSAPTTLAAYPGETAVIRPPAGASRIVSFSSARYIVLDGFIMDGANLSSDGIKISHAGSNTAEFIRVRNSELKNAPAMGILVSGESRGNEFINMKVHHNGGLRGDLNHGFYIEGANNLVERCDIHDNTGKGVQIYKEGGGAVDNNIVRYNKIHDNAKPGPRGVGIILSTGRGNKAHDNLIWGNSGGIQVDYGSNGAMIFNNTIFSNNGPAAQYGISLSGSGTNTVARNNIVYQNSGGNITGSQSGQILSNNLTTDPLFVNSGGLDFHLRSGSPAIDAGINLSAQGVTVDFDGTPRPLGAAYDIGAFEYAGAVPPPTGDTTPPVLSAVAASAVSQTGATIAWTTNEAADTQVEYGPTTAYAGATILNAALTTSHSAVLGDLTAGTLYHYRVKSRDAAGNLATSADGTFTTSAFLPGAGCVNSAGTWQNITLPVQTGSFSVEYDAVPGAANMDGVSGLSNGAAAAYAGLAAAVRFNNTGMIDARDGGGYAAAAAIPYVAGLTYHVRLVVNIPVHTYSAYARQGANAERLLGQGYAFRTEQAAVTTLNNLGLFASLGSMQVCGAAVTASGPLSDTTAPVLSGISAAAVGQTDATIAWTTNEAADTQVDYGPTTAYGSSTVRSSALTTGHSAVLGGLTVGTLYHYRVKSRDDAGNLATSADFTFTTAAPADTTPPVLSAVAASGVGQTSATIGWTTNEAADAQVEYGPTAAYGASTFLNAALTTSHSAAIGGLTAGTLYHYRVKSKDGAGNLATSADATFTTAAPAPVACINSAGAWANAALTPQAGNFTAEFDAVPGAVKMDAVIGLSNGPAAEYSRLAPIVRFNNSGYIDARNGGAYAAAAVIPYAAGQSYRFRLDINLASRKYSAYVRPGGNAEQVLGSGYSFRSEQAAAAALNNLAIYASAGSLAVCGVAVK